MLDLFRFFCQDFEQVKCFASTSYWKFSDLEDNAFVILKNAQGQTAASVFLRDIVEAHVSNQYHMRRRLHDRGRAAVEIRQLRP
jgi:predicted dehydrogenase